MKKEPFYAPIDWFSKRYSQIYKRISRAKRHELVSWLNVCSKVSETNCWWAAYAAANYIRPEILHELRQRDYKIRERMKARKIPYGFGGIPRGDFNGT